MIRFIPTDLRRGAILVACAAFAAYAASLANDLLAADLRLIDVATQGYDPDATGRFLHWWFEMQGGLFDLHAVGYRLIAVLLHVINCGLVLLVARQFTSATTAGLGALIFAVWPSGSQAILSLGSQTALLATGLVLSALYLASARGHLWLRTIGFVAAVVLALNASAQATVLPLLLLLIHRRQQIRGAQPPSLTMHLVAYGAVVVWLLIRLPRWLGSGDFIDVLRNPLVQLPTTQRIMIALDQGWQYAQLAVMPIRLSADYGFGVIESETSLVTGLRVGLLLGLVLLALVRYMKKADFLTFGMLWTAAAILPVSNVIAATSDAFSEAHLYLAMVGFSLSLAASSSSLFAATRQRMGRWIVFLLVLLACRQTIWRCADWRDAERLWARTVVVQPTSAQAHLSLGTLLQARGATVAAQAHYQRAIGIYPRFAAAHYNLGLSLYNEGEWAEALAQFDMTCQLEPQRAAAHLNRGAALFRLGQWMQAADAYRHAAELRPAWPVPWLNLADALRAAGDVHAAAAAIEEARRLGAILPFD